jgi:hypothetical protein
VLPSSELEEEDFLNQTLFKIVDIYRQQENGRRVASEAGFCCQGNNINGENVHRPLAAYS